MSHRLGEVFFRGVRDQQEEDKYNCTIRLFVCIAQVATCIYKQIGKSGVRLEWRRIRKLFIALKIRMI